MATARTRVAGAWEPGGRAALRGDCGAADSEGYERLAALLTALVEEVRGLRADLTKREQPSSLSRVDRDLLARLLPPIAGAVGSGLFVAHELIEAENAALRVALRGFNAKQLGRLLRRAVGIPIDGLVVERIASEAGAVVWRVSEFLGNGNLSVPHATRDGS